MRFPAIRRFAFDMRFETDATMPPYKGAVLRGAVGATIRRHVCDDPKRNCPDCERRRECVYAVLFEPCPPEHFANAAKFSAATPPYVLNPPLTTRQKFCSGEDMGLELVLIGKAADALPFFVFGFSEAGRRGLGRNFGKFRLLSVSLKNGKDSRPVYDGTQEKFVDWIGSDDPWQPPQIEPSESNSGQIRLRFHTPLRIKNKGSLCAKFSFPLFFAALLRRLELLGTFYGDGFEIPDADLLLRRAERMEVVDDRTRWYDWKRFCRRQNYTMKIGGLTGPVVLKGDPAPFLPLLRLGEMVNVGHGTSFGLGKFAAEIP